MQLLDDFFPPDLHRAINMLLKQTRWQWGWRSNTMTPDGFKFFHKHYAGTKDFDKDRDCTAELAKSQPLFYELWRDIQSRMHMADYSLVRCYANAQPFGTEGTVHIDAKTSTARTIIYYPHVKWDMEWAGETIFCNDAKTDIIHCIYPKPNRLIVFNGNMPHCARAVSRSCPEMRIVLVWKVELDESLRVS